MTKYLEIRSLESKEKADLAKMLNYTYAELVSSIKNQIKDGPCKDIVETFVEKIISKTTL